MILLHYRPFLIWSDFFAFYFVFYLHTLYVHMYVYICIQIITNLFVKVMCYNIVTLDIFLIFYFRPIIITIEPFSEYVYFFKTHFVVVLNVFKAFELTFSD